MGMSRRLTVSDPVILTKRVGAAVTTATLYHGDCLEILPALKADFVFTDPPYGHNNNNGDLIHNREKALGEKTKAPAEPRAIANDGPEANNLFQSVLPLLHAALPHGGCCCCCGGGGPDPQFARWSLWMDEVFDFKQMVVWDKGPIGMGWHYRRSYETILVGQKPGAACRWFDDSQQIENIIRPGYRGIAKILPGAHQHPTEKPYQLAGHFIRLHSQPGETVLDPFMGCGSTAIAAMRMGRNFVGIELDPAHFKETVQRLKLELEQPEMFEAAKVAPMVQEDLIIPLSLSP